MRLEKVSHLVLCAIYIGSVFCGVGVSRALFQRSTGGIGSNSAARHKTSSQAPEGDPSLNSKLKKPIPSKTAEDITTRTLQKLDERVTDLERQLSSRSNSNAAPPMLSSSATTAAEHDPLTALWKSGRGFRGIIALSALAILCLSAMALAMVTLRRRINVSEAETRGMRNSLDSMKDETKKQVVAQSEKLAKEFGLRFSELMEDLNQKGARYEESHRVLREEIETIKEGKSPVAPRSNQKRPNDEDGLSFPVSVADYLAYLNKQNISVLEAKPDVLRGSLIPEQEGEFIITDGKNSDHAQFMLPKTTRLSSSQEYHVYYKDYYLCDEPSPGEIWVINPAVVISDAAIGGWRLQEKGRLEIK